MTTTCNLIPNNRLCEIGRDAIRIPGIVIVGATVVVDITEIVTVVVIWRTLPPIGGGTKRSQQTTKNDIQRHTQIFVYLLLSLFNTLVKRLFSVSIRHPSDSLILFNLFFASLDFTVFPLDVSKQPSGFCIIIS